MASDLERFRGELEKFRGTSRIDVPRYGLPARAKAVYEEAATRRAIIDAAQRLAQQAGQADNQLALGLQRGILQTTAGLEATEQEYSATSPRVAQIAEQITDIFSEQNAAHNAAYYQAFAEQTIRQLSQEIQAPPPRERRRFRLFREEP